MNEDIKNELLDMRNTSSMTIPIAETIFCRLYFENDVFTLYEGMNCRNAIGTYFFNSNKSTAIGTMKNSPTLSTKASEICEIINRNPIIGFNLCININGVNDTSRNHPIPVLKKKISGKDKNTELYSYAI